MSETIRLAKRVAEVFECSRTQAVQYIESGNVEVDGVVVDEPGARVAPDARISLLPNAKLAPVEPITILFHKPAGMPAADAVELFVPDNQSPEDHSGIRFLRRHKNGLELLDPLEAAASGLMVLSQDFYVKRKLTDDLMRVEQEYVVEVANEIIPDGLALLNRSITFNGKQIPKIRASRQSETTLRFAMKSASSARAIAHLCEKVGLSIVSIKRLRMGRLPIAGVAPGQWRYLTRFEEF
ncbi:MAG: S4 domain-containing protein [Lacisediminimonas sp.]|nr:S4 domain-containing protein [Lacisediminimonas sp.]